MKVRHKRAHDHWTRGSEPIGGRVIRAHHHPLHHLHHPASSSGLYIRSPSCRGYYLPTYLPTLWLLLRPDRHGNDHVTSPVGIHVFQRFFSPLRYCDDWHLCGVSHRLSSSAVCSVPAGAYSHASPPPAFPNQSQLPAGWAPSIRPR